MSDGVVDNVGASAVDYDPFGGAAISRVVPTTEPQREVWLADRLGRDASLAYNESVSFHFSGPLQIAALREALSGLADRHEALRSTLGADGETLCIGTEASLEVPLHDHSALPAGAAEAALQAAKRSAVETPFDLERGPLMRAAIHKLAPGEHVLVLTMHHIVCDGWSFGVLARDLGSLYAQRVGARPATPPQAAQFGDYSVAQGDFNGSTGFVADEAFWLSRFPDTVPTLDLPTDRPRAAWRTFTSKRIDYSLDPALVGDVRKMAGRKGAGLFGALLAGFAGTLQRITGASDVVVGVPAAGQSQEGFEDLVGHCVNMLPVRLKADPLAAAGTLVSGAQSALLDAQEHQRYTFGTLLKKLALKRDPSRLPLVSVVFNLDQALDANALGFAGLRVTFGSNPRAYENFELFINAVQVNGGLILETQYNTDLFDDATVRRWLACYEKLLRAMCATGTVPLRDLDVLSEDDRRLVALWNATARPYERGIRLGDLVARGMAAHREREAVVFEGHSTSYAQLEDMAWSIALHLRAHGVKPGTLVGVCLERSVELVATLLGVIYSGGAYVPLDPSYPVDRLARMCEDAGMAIVVTRGTERVRIAGALPANARVITLDAAPLPPAPQEQRVLVGHEDDPAYVIFTSGSTGRPKGAMNAHKGIVNRLLWMQEAYKLGPTDRVMQKTPYSFDVSVWEFFWPVMVGATVVVARPDGHREPKYLMELIRTGGVTTMHFVPSMLRAFIMELEAERLDSLKRVICSGEGLPFDLVESFFARLPRVALVNLYGPTEAAVDVTAWECKPRDPRGIVPIGMPIANTTIYILDDDLREVPVGTPGELYIGGIQVGMGYVSRPDLSAERFLPDPFRPGERMYKTGDIARWRNDGAIEHLGRADFQVKVRGLRIELGEIENALASFPGLAMSVVMAREDRPGDVRLVAYLVAKAAAALPEEPLKEHLRKAVPEYMVPQHFVVLPEIPLLSNGKVDRKALPAPQALATGNREYVAPRNDLERTVAKEMETSLGMPGVGVHDDFFQLGGHSLLAAQLTARLNRALGTHLTMRTLFAAPTIERLAAAIEAEAQAPAVAARKPIEPLAARGEAPASVMQERLWFMEELYPGRVTYNAPSAHRLAGPLDEAAFERAMREIVRRQASLRTTFEARGSEVVQRIHDTMPVSLFPAEDLSAAAPAEREARLRERLEALTAQTFDLASGPLFKAHLFRLAPQEHVLFFMAHHIVWDGWSFDLLYDEMSALYGAFTAGRESPLQDLRIAYGDFAAWHRDWSRGPESAQQLAFWKARLEKIGQVQELPTDKPRRPGMSGGGSTEWMAIDAARTHALHELSRRCGTTVFVTTLAIYCALLHGFSRQSRLVVGTPVRGRNTLELESVMGFFNNLLPLQLEVDPAGSFLGLVERLKAVVVDCFAHPDIPLEQLASELSVSRGSGGTMLYQALFSFQDARQRITQWGALAHDNIPLFQRSATEDLGMWFLESAHGLHGGVTYNTDILTPATAQALRRGYLALVDQVLATPEAPVGKLVGPEGADIHVLEPARVEPGAPKATAGGTGPAPTTETEKILAAIWCEQLKLASVATSDNFFELGGHSLIAMQAILAMEAKTGKRIERGRYIFETLGQIARSYDEAPLEAAAKGGGIRGIISGIFGRKSS